MKRNDKRITAHNEGLSGIGAELLNLSISISN